MNKYSDFKILCIYTSENSNNSTSELWLVEDKVTGQVSAAFLLLILVVGLPWNLLVVLTIVKEKLYRQPAIILLLNLAVNDAIVLLFLTPGQIVTGFAGEFILGRTDAERCIVCYLGVTEILFSMMSIYIIAIMSLDRFLFVYKPLHYERIVTSCRMIIVLLLLWLFLFLLTVLPLLHFRVSFRPAYLTCFLDFSARNIIYFVFLLVAAVLPVLTFLILNVWLVVIVQRNIRAIYTTRHAGKKTESHHDEFHKTMKKKRQQKEKHMFRVFGALIGLNMIFWLPIIAFSTYLASAMPEEYPTQLMAATSVLFAFQVVGHPIIETLLIKEVREPMKKMVLCCCAKTRQKSGVILEESGRSLWSCESSRLGWCGEFMSILHDAVLQYSEHQQSSDVEKMPTAVHQGASVEQT